MTVDRIAVEFVTKFVFIGARITNDGLRETEVRRRLAMGKAVVVLETSDENMVDGEKDKRRHTQ